MIFNRGSTPAGAAEQWSVEGTDIVLPTRPHVKEGPRIAVAEILPVTCKDVQVEVPKDTVE